MQNMHRPRPRGAAYLAARMIKYRVPGIELPERIQPNPARNTAAVCAMHGKVHPQDKWGSGQANYFK